MHPLQYQRPQAPSTSGNIAQAEKVISALQAAGALERRFARFEEIQTLWTPQPTPQSQPAGVFGHLLPGVHRDTPMDLGAQVMTWDKFARTVLPTAERIDYSVPLGRESYAAFVTAVNGDAPPLLQWDREERRNPVSWYVYHGDSPPTQWGLTGGTWRL